jgi:dTDP-4-dehydrorhamnose reductase
MKKILVTGSNGLLGQKLVYKLLENKEVQLIATARGKNRLKVKEGYVFESLDITDAKNIEEVFQKHKPTHIIHTAAMTNVDQCEFEKELCMKINIDAINYLTQSAKKIDAHFTHLSTDFIFDGEKGSMYNENDEPNPVSFYGWSKLAAERVVISSGVKNAILRTVLVYGIVDDMSRSNIVLWAKGALEKGEPINVVNDQFRTPTLAEDLADGCILASTQNAEGIYNISGKNYYCIIDLVKAVADYYKLDSSIINEVSSTTLNQPAKRPPLTGFDISKAQKELGYNPHSFEEGIAILEKQIS